MEKCRVYVWLKDKIYYGNLIVGKVHMWCGWKLGILGEIFQDFVFNESEHFSGFSGIYFEFPL